MLGSCDIGKLVRYRLDIAYHGANFHGWQRQPNLRTVQGELELWLTRLLPSGEAIAVTGAGRTDAGVHASGMVAHFDTGLPLDCGTFLHRLRAALPDDMTVTRVSPVDGRFHSRYTAIARTYEYRVTDCSSPFDRDRVWTVRDPLDADRLGDAATLMLGRHDFSGFCLAVSKKDDNHCSISQSSWEKTGEQFVYRVRADRFLHMMVRLMVGTMVDIARSRWPASRMSDILRIGDVRLCGGAAPAHGLTLVAVQYPPSRREAAISVEINDAGPFLD